MKLRKITAFIVALVAVFATLTTLPKITKVSAEETVQFVQGYDSYTIEYILSKFFVAPTEEGDETKADGFKFKSATDAGSGDLIIKDDYTFTCKEGNYDVVLCDGETVITDTDKYYSATTFKVISPSSIKDENDSISYSVTKEDYDAYKEAVNEKLDGKKIRDSVTLPEIEDLVVSTYFDYNALKTSGLTLYYCKPNSSSFTSSSSKTITLSHVGTYSFYFEVKDPVGNQLTVDREALNRKVVAGIEGWYGESDKLVAPIFTFEFSAVANPEITISSTKKPEKGFLNLTYNDLDDYITIVHNNNEHISYELWYYASQDANSGLEAGVENWTSEGVEKVTGDQTQAVNVTEVEEYQFNKSTLSFLPVKAGHYYVVVTVYDEFGMDQAVSYGVAVHDEFTEVSYETEFFKNNWLSFLFLGIALLSLIGIILLIFIKPKEEVEEEVDVIEKK